MKKLLLTAGICLSSLFFVQAQQSTAPNADEQVEKMMKGLTATCHLTPDQVTKAKPIVTEFVNSKIANKQKYGTDKDKMKTAMQTSKTTMNTKLNAILNADQQKELADKESEIKTERAAKTKTKASDNDNK